MEDGSLDKAPIWSDLTTFDPEPWRGRVDIIAGGFPCQPFSVAGRKRGADDERNLWPHVARLAERLGLPTLFLENVPGILRYYWDVIRPELQEMGYRVAEGLFTASETGAPHKRERLFILAHTVIDRDRGRGEGLQSEGRHGGQVAQHRLRDQAAHWPTPATRDYKGFDGAGKKHPSRPRDIYLSIPPGPADHDGWARMLTEVPEAQPTFCRVAHGPAPGVDRRLRAIGNGVVPAVAAAAYKYLRKESASGHE